MIKPTLVLASLCAALTLPAAARAEDKSLVCSLVPVLTESFLKTHVAIKTASDDLYAKAADQMIKRIDPSKTLLLQSDVDDLRPKILKFLKTMRTAPDCTDLDHIRELLVKRAKEQAEYAKTALGDKYKLDENVELVLDPEKRKFAATTEESRARQLIQIHFQISNYLLTDMKLPKAKEQLKHRYDLTVKRMEELKASDLHDYMVNAFASAMDPHSSYMGPESTEDFRINMQLSLEGIGASLSNDDGYTVIQELIPGGSASKSKLLLPKDKIIAVGQGAGKPKAKDAGKGEAKEADDMENVIDLDLKDVVGKIRGKAGTTVRLTILREKPQVQRFNVSLVRSKVSLEDDAAKVEMTDRKVDGQTMKLARIELPGFYGGQKRTDRTSYKDVAAAVEKAKKAGAEGILFDLSTNSGGLLDEAVRIAGLFLNRGNVVATKDSDGEVQMLDDIDSRVQFDGPMVVLISRLSASASEIVAGALQDYKRAVIVGGDHTYGKGSVQAVLPLQNDFGIVKVTTGLFFIPGGNSTQHRGVTSDIGFPSPFSTPDIGEKFLDNSLKPDSIKPFLSPEANEGNKWAAVSKAEIEKLRLLSQARVGKSKEFAEITKELKDAEEKKGVVKLADIRKKESESKKKTKDKSPKLLARERNKPQIDEGLSILADFVSMRKQGSHKLMTEQEAAAGEKKE